MSLLLALLFLAHAEPVDRVIAIVEEELVLASEVTLGQALTEHDPTASAFWSLPRRHEQERLIDAAMIRASAGEIALYTPTDADVSARNLSIHNTFGDEADARAFFAAWGLSETSLTALVTHRLTIERYLKRNLQTPTTDPQWPTELEQLLEGLRESTRVRRIAEQQ